MDFKLLGPLEVSHEGRRLAIGGPRQHVTLAMLLLEPDRVVPLDRLVEAVWDDEPPATARSQIQICISSLRRTLAEADPGPAIETVSPGYLLRPQGSTIDLRQFDAGVAEARAAAGAGELGAAVVLFRTALGLWRGPALSNVDSMLVRRAVAHLDERLLTVLEECLTAELAAGRARDVVGELVELAQRYPLRERLKALLMTALHRAGRQAEALEVYRRARADLIEQLGIEPGDELQKLHQAILNGDPGLIAEPAPQPAAPRPAGQVRPRMLPSDIADFTGRSAVVSAMLAETGAAASGGPSRFSVPVHVVFGPGGTGKTTLAIHVAHRLSEQFPDGQLYARLRASEGPVDPADVLGRFLRALGAPGSALPESLEERAELYRNMLGGRRVLVVLDDAMSDSQVLPLLPGNPGCSVLVTGRRSLAALPVTKRYELRAIDLADATELMTKILGRARVGDASEDLDALCRLCGGLPLTLRIVAARLAARPHWSVADMIERLRDEAERLDELGRGDTGLRASIRLSYDGLSEQARLLLRRLAVSDTPSFPPWVGAPLLETSVRQAEDVVGELAETYLIDTEPAPVGEPVRYRFHELVRPFARERLLTEESGAERREALERLLGALLFLALAAHRREYSGDNMLPSGEVGVWPLPDEYADRLLAEPLAWFERERSVLVGGVLQAAASGLSAQAWNLALCAVTLFESHSYFADWRQTHESALRAAVAAGDRRGEAAMRYSLGSLELFEQLNEAAAAHLEAAREIFTELGDRHGAGHALRNIAVIDRRDGRLDEAIERGGRALRMLREAGDRVGEAHTLHNLAHARLDQGSDEVARGLLDSAAQICAEVGNRRVYAQVQRQLGELNLRRGELESAAECFRRVLEIVLETDDKVGQCYALIGLANVDIRRGRPEQALRILREVAQTTAAIGNPLLDDRVGLALAQAEGRSAGVGAPEDQVAGAGRADARDGRDGRDSAVTRESRAT